MQLYQPNNGSIMQTTCSPTPSDFAHSPITDLVSLYPATGVDQHCLSGIRNNPMVVPDGALLFEENQPCQGFSMVLEGEVQVSRRSGEVSDLMGVKAFNRACSLLLKRKTA